MAIEELRDPVDASADGLGIDQVPRPALVSGVVSAPDGPATPSEYVGASHPKGFRARPDLGGSIITEPYAGGEVRVPTIERTLVDVFDHPDLGGWEEIWRSLELVESFDLEAVPRHATALGSALASARLGLFLEQYRERLFVEERHLAVLREQVPNQARYLDRTRTPGRLVKPWNLIVPSIVRGRSSTMLVHEQLERAADEPFTL